MASRSQKSGGGSARTAPKGRATAKRGTGTGRRRLLSPGVEWALAIIAFLVVLAVLFFIFRDARPTTALAASVADWTVVSHAPTFPDAVTAAVV